MRTKYTDNQGNEVVTEGIPANTYACMGGQWAKKGELMKVIHGPVKDGTTNNLIISWQREQHSSTKSI